MSIRIVNVVGARPNLMKIAPIMEAYERYPDIEPVLVHTGQHYDANMDSLFFEQLGIPRPDVNLEVGSGTHGAQTAAIIQAFERWVLERDKPDAVVVVGDVNGTMACALVAAKLHIPVVHVEAGLRSEDRSMPEEINRIVTDAVSDILFVTEDSGLEHLAREGVPSERIHLVGNVMIDALMKQKPMADESTILQDLGVESGGYALVTLHRPSNVDDPDVLGGLLGVLEHVASRIPVVFPIHPRTRKRLTEFGLQARVNEAGIILTEPLGYLEFLKLTSDAGIVLTDSGGIQEETTALGVKCLTLRHNTERPATITMGTNRLVGNDPEVVRKAFDDAMADESAPTPPHPLWDGKAAERTVRIMREVLGER